MFNLQILELRGNTLESTAGLNLPKLKNLYLVKGLASLEGGTELLQSLAPPGSARREEAVSFKAVQLLC